MVKIGLFGGSFDPVHNGHILLAEKAMKQLKLNRLIFIPAYSPPHKSWKMTVASRRRKMIQLALACRKKFSISDFEIRLKKKVYTYQTLGYFQKKYPDAVLYLIIGSDSAAEMINWKNSEKIKRQGKIAVGKRKNNGFDKKKYFTPLEKAPDSCLGYKFEVTDGSLKLPSKFAKRPVSLTGFIELSGIIKNISSTGIRRRAAGGLPLKGLVPPAVEKYIKKNGLYPAL